jgi:hypothetical protein
MASAPFFLAVNYPWLNYGRDFGISQVRSAADRRLSQLAPNRCRRFHAH